MLKAELEKLVESQVKEIQSIKDMVRSVSERALENCCNEAIPYVSELNEGLGLGISKDGYISVSCNIPIDILNKWDELEIDHLDVKLTIGGVEIEVTELTEIEEN